MPVFMAVSGGSSTTGDVRPGQLQVLVAASYSLFAQALAYLLSRAPLCASISTATSSDAAMEELARGPFDLVICDLKLEPRAGPQLATQILAAYPRTRVILLADPEDWAPLLAATRSSATGFFTKDTPVSELLEGIEAVIRGHHVLGA